MDILLGAAIVIGAFISILSLSFAFSLFSVISKSYLDKVADKLRREK
jgi:hypothetical protein